MRKIVIAGNWKMNSSVEFVNELVSGLLPISASKNNIDIVFCPPSLYVAQVVEKLAGSTVRTGVQNIYPEPKGAFTGEISADMAKDIGATYVIIGHSERRQFFGETDESVAKKTSATLKTGLIPIVCVGESLAEREAGKLETIISNQVSKGLFHLDPTEMKKVIVAYEPVWAIGTGKTASPEQAQEVHAFIRKILSDKFGADVSQKVVIQYGGSVNDKNAQDLLGQKDIDGALVGGASLKVDAFGDILNIANNISK